MSRRPPTGHRRPFGSPGGGGRGVEPVARELLATDCVCNTCLSRSKSIMTVWRSVRPDRRGLGDINWRRGFGDNFRRGDGVRLVRLSADHGLDVCRCHFGAEREP